MKNSVVQSNEAISSFKSVVQLESVSKWYGNFRCLDNVQFNVTPGERIVVCGPSGSGKSTLIRCINGIEAHDEGKVRVAGYELTRDRSTLDRVRLEVGMVFQQFNLFPNLTVLENCTLALQKVKKMPKKEAVEIAKIYLSRVHLPHLSDRYPDQLSGGQQQRVAIARALCMKPRVMLFDEPTAALDPEMVREVLDVMTELASEGMTMIVVTHEIAFARSVASRVVFMDAGRIVESASPTEFFDAPKSDRARSFLQQVIRH